MPPWSPDPPCIHPLFGSLLLSWGPPWGGTITHPAHSFKHHGSGTELLPVGVGQGPEVPESPGPAGASERRPQAAQGADVLPSSAGAGEREQGKEGVQRGGCWGDLGVALGGLGETHAWVGTVLAGLGPGLEGLVATFAGFVFQFPVCTFFRLLWKRRVGSFLSKQTGFNCCYCQYSCKYHIKRALWLIVFRIKMRRTMYRYYASRVL